MATSSTAPTKAPRPHEGPHYANPSSKPIRGPFGAADRDDVQWFIWNLFFVLVLFVFALGVVLSLVTRHA